jgi:hypothetical protein
VVNLTVAGSKKRLTLVRDGSGAVIGGESEDIDD